MSYLEWIKLISNIYICKYDYLDLNMNWIYNIYSSNNQSNYTYLDSYLNYYSNNNDSNKFINNKSKFNIDIFDWFYNVYR